MELTGLLRDKTSVNHSGIRFIRDVILNLDGTAVSTSVASSFTDRGRNSATFGIGVTTGDNGVISFARWQGHTQHGNHEPYVGVYSAPFQTLYKEALAELHRGAAIELALPRP